MSDNILELYGLSNNDDEAIDKVINSVCMENMKDEKEKPQKVMVVPRKETESWFTHKT